MLLSRKVSNGINIVAALVALYAALFFWTRGWIGFTSQSIPWLVYTLAPYIAFWLLSMKLQKVNVTKGRNIIFLISALGLLGVTSYVYLQFTNEHMIFYLRQFLAILPIVSIVGLLLVVGIGSLLTRRSIGTPQSGAP